jgi:hypothetical protein
MTWSGENQRTSRSTARCTSGGTHAGIGSARVADDDDHVRDVALDQSGEVRGDRRYPMLELSPRIAELPPAGPAR